MSKPIDLNSILNEFILESEISVYGNGHINDTYITNTKNYILQRINTGIFKNPDELMQNIENVTNHIRLKMKALGRDEDRSTLTVVKTRKGESYVKCDDDHVYRVYKFINGSETIEKAENDVHMYNAGKGFGEFQQMLTDYPVDTLFDTIPNFHNTVKRVEALETAIKENRTGRLIFVKDEVEFALSRAKDASVIVEGIEDCLVRFSRCCNPVPGDDIIGYITRGRGVSVHRKDCPNMISSENSDDKIRLIPVHWENDNEQKGSYLTKIQVLANDRKGLLAELAGAISDLKILITGINSKLTKDNVVIINFTIEINSKEDIESVANKLNNIRGVFEVKRRSE